jgi:hypothetical protein
MRRGAAETMKMRLIERGASGAFADIDLASSSFLFKDEFEPAHCGAKDTDLQKANGRDIRGSASRPSIFVVTVLTPATT